MAFCRNCGKEIEETVKFCPYCGVDVTAPQEEPKTEPKVDIENIMNTPEEQVDAQDAADNKWLALIGYIGLLFLVPMLAAPNSKFARFHANQSIVLFIAGIILGVATTMVGWIPLVGWLFAAVAGVLPTVFMILGMVNAFNGKAKELPIIGKYRILK